MDTLQQLPTHGDGTLDMRELARTPGDHGKRDHGRTSGHGLRGRGRRGGPSPEDGLRQLFRHCPGPCPPFYLDAILLSKCTGYCTPPEFKKGRGDPVGRKGVSSRIVSPEARGVDVDMFMEERVATDLLQMIETVY